MSTTQKFTSADLELMPDNGSRYEIIEGELYGSRLPSFEHQYTCSRLGYFLEDWNDRGGLGLAVPTPGLVFAEDDDVAPDVVWISRERYAEGVDAAGHLRLAPELVIEVLPRESEREARPARQTKALFATRRVGVLDSELDWTVC